MIMQQIHGNQNRGHILEQVHQIACEHLHGDNATLYLFGSWARKEEQKSSDIDLGIYYETPLPTGTMARLRSAYEDSNIPYRVELVDLTETSESFRNKVMEEGDKWNV
jgi:predicted nucleotidyltransferase